MGRDKETRKKFIEYLDRILAGEEIPADLDMDEELRATLEFARKMSVLRPIPSDTFQAQLKAGLLQKLDAQEARAKEGQGSFWRTLWRQPVWQGAITVAFAVFIVGMLWRAGIFSPELSQPTATETSTPTQTTTSTTTETATATETATIPQEVFLSVDAATDKIIYESGEKVRIELELINRSPEQLTIEKLPPILSLMSIETGQPVFTFAAGQETRTLAPNQTVKFTLTWNQVDFHGQPVTGVYYLEIEDLVYQGQPIQLHLGTPVLFEIVKDL
jgi:hypothetical protein